MPFTHADRQQLSEITDRSQRLLTSFKKLPRKGKDLERLKLLETIVQSCEVLTLLEAPR